MTWIRSCHPYAFVYPLAMPRLIVLAAALLVSVCLVACQESHPTELPDPTVEPTAQPTVTPTPALVPTSVPTPAASPTRTLRPTPTATLTPTPSPTPLPSPLIAYALQCGLVLFQLDSGENIDDPASYTWGVFAQDIDRLVERYGGLIPPPELAHYHTANLSSWTNLRDAARQRPDGDSFIADYLALVNEIHDELFLLLHSSYIAEEEKERLSDEILVTRVSDFFGQDTYTAGQIAQQHFAMLHLEAREALGLHECTSPLFFLDAEAETESNEADRAALRALYNATDGPNWSDNTNWGTDTRLESGLVWTLMQVAGSAT